MKYYFNEPFMLVSHGKDNEIEFIQVPAPTARIIACCELEEEVNKALMYLANNKQDMISDETALSQKEEDIKISEQIGYLLSMGNASLQKCYSALRSCITQSKSLLNGDIKCTNSIYDEIPYCELKGLLGEYIANFINSLQ